MSPNPTPLNPVALKMAMQQPTGDAVYLARPCQYIEIEKSDVCERGFWTDSRFSEQVVASMNNALNKIKNDFNAKKIELVGFSGGGAIALLLAARRDDVANIITVAGNLDHTQWTKHHRISPLTNSLNPASEISALEKIKQVHLVGENDKVVPPFLAEQFIASFTKANGAQVVALEGYTHSCCWAENWAFLYSQYGWQGHEY